MNSGSPRYGLSDQSQPAGAPAGLSPLYVLEGSGAPVDGVTGVGVLPAGGFYRNTDNGQYYTNVGTIGVPAFQLMIQA